MAKNDNLHQAKKEKNDEFYTQLSDIEKELNNYKDFFNGKVVYCNCDDPRESNFFKFFSMNFERLGLKKLITTGYKKDGHGVAFVYEGDKNGNRKVDETEIQTTQLEGNGGFETAECIEFLKEADVVVTNPPFSLFRDYVKQLMDYNKKFLIIGNPNAITYKEIFPYIKENKLWVGCKSMGSDMLFNVSEEFEKQLVETKKKGSGYRIVDGKVLGRASAIWFTNINNPKRNRPLDLYRKYNQTDYPKYDNYDAINVDKVTDIPEDYDGVMGVPISFLDKYCPTQFEIVWQASGNTKASAPKEILEKLNYIRHKEDRGGCGVINGKRKYDRLFIRRIS